MSNGDYPRPPHGHSREREESYENEQGYPQATQYGDYGGQADAQSGMNQPQMGQNQLNVAEDVDLIDDERIVGSWFTGSVGIFPKRDFYLTITSRRVLLQSSKTGGEVNYQDALLEHIRSVGFSVESIMKPIIILAVGGILALLFLAFGIINFIGGVVATGIIYFILMIFVAGPLIAYGIYKLIKRKIFLGFYIRGLSGPISIPTKKEFRQTIRSIPKKVYEVKDSIDYEKG